MTAVDYGSKINDYLDDSNDEIKELILIFSAIDYISSIGLRVILELQKKISNQNASMKLVGVTPAVRKYLK
jgi:anti-anti-sigma factor